MNNRVKHKRGLGIIAAILIMLVVAVMGITLASLLGTNSQGSVNYMQSQRAFYLAESGIQQALLAMRGHFSPVLSNQPIPGPSVGYGDYNYTIVSDISSCPTSPNIIVRSIGTVSNQGASQARREVHVCAQRTNLFNKWGGFAGGSGGGSTVAVKLGGGAYTDSYDSSIGLYNVGGNIGQDGDIGTNADITVTGGASIGGDATTGPLGTFNNDAAVSGAISHDANVTLPAVVVPASLTSLSSSGNIKGTATIPLPASPGVRDYKFDQFSISSSETITITGPANIYLTGANSIKMTGSSQIIVSDTSAGPVVIYADGDVSAAGQGITNTTLIPSNFQLYGSKSSPTQDIKLTGGSSFYGLVYAPNGALTLSGITNLYGSYIGDTLTMSGGGALHHDTSPLLADNVYLDFMTNWRPSSWQEVY